jgi:hypothetical protein
MPPLRFFVHVIASVAESSGRALIGRRRRRAWPFLFEVVVGVLRRNFLHSARLPVAEARAFNEAVAAAQPKRHHVAVTNERLAGVPVARFVPKGPPPSRLLVYLHGGSYVMGSLRTHEDLIARIAAARFRAKPPRSHRDHRTLGRPHLHRRLVRGQRALRLGNGRSPARASSPRRGQIAARRSDDQPRVRRPPRPAALPDPRG